MPSTDPQRPAPRTGSRSRRDRVTRRSVHVAERVAGAFIRLGGVGTIIAVATIFGFLFYVVLPLFQGATVGEPRTTATRAGTASPVALGSDEYGSLTWTVFDDGRLEVLSDVAKQPLHDAPLVPGSAPTAIAVPPAGSGGVLGFADGSVRLVSIGFSTQRFSALDEPAGLASLARGNRQVHDGGVAERLETGQVRLQRVTVKLGEPIALGDEPIVRVDRADLSSGYAILAVDASGAAALHRIEEKRNLFDRNAPPKVSRASAQLPYDRAAIAGVPAAVAVPGAGDNAYLVWEDGRTLRFDTRDLDSPQLAETIDVVPAQGATVTALGWMLGRTTLVVGDSTGSVRGAFRIKPYDASTPDGSLWTIAHELERGPAAVTSISAGQRNKVLTVGYADGTLRAYQMTTERLLADVKRPGGALLAVGLSPREDALLARSAEETSRWSFHASHPEAGLGAVFGKVWYEGLEKPEHVWQSTGGTDDFEPKLGLVPLVFGTLKGTLYSMLFGVPLALLAAVFTSEFLGARLRTKVKSVIEIMASLPSVVLGFLAAIVVAPFVQGVIPAVLTAFLVVPTVLLLGAHLWQLLPQHVALRLAGLPRLACLVAVFPISILLSGALAPALERSLFQGDLVGWLHHDVTHAELRAGELPRPAAGADMAVPGRAAFLAAMAGMTGPSAEDAQALRLEAGMQVAGKKPAPNAEPLLTAAEKEKVREAHQSGAWGGWTYLVFPLAVAIVLLSMGAFVNPSLRRASREWSRRRCGFVALGKYAAGLVAIGLVAGGLGWLLTQAGADPRGSFEYATRGEGALMGSPVQRNALVVGFLMGFAIIPIIYTLAEDALSSVPHQLRLGSLGAGATPWQTATRIIIPTAMSGLFSAIMIGLGRAVGETMIVLMAAGNTSVLDWNVWTGFRTLSANLATEMPEAVVGSTHYRVLFLAAFTLFVITFVLNTIAESVRQRFRKRAFQL